MPRAVAKCNKIKEGKLIVCVESPFDDFANHVKVLAKRTDIPAAPVEIESAKVKKHPYYLTSSKMIDGISRTKVPVGTYTVCFKENNTIEQQNIQVVEKSDHNRRNPHARLTVPLNRLEIKSQEVPGKSAVTNAQFTIQCDNNELKYRCQNENAFSLFAQVPAWGSIIKIEADEQLEFVSVATE